MKANIVRPVEAEIRHREFKQRQMAKKFMEELLDPEKESTAEKAALYEKQEHNEFYVF